MAPTRAKPDPKTVAKYLRSLCDNVLLFLKELDLEMEKPASVERGRRLGALARSLQFALDSARYFGLGIDFRRDPVSRKRETARAARVRHPVDAERERIRRGLEEEISLLFSRESIVAEDDLRAILDRIMPKP